MAKYAQCLLWCDLETTTLPVGNDYSGVHVLEVAFILTDFDLEPYEGYQESIKMTRAAADSLRANDYTKKMHTENGLIKDCIASTVTLAEAEAEVIRMIEEKTTFEPGEIMLAGSGIAAFDRPVIKHWMPKLDRWLAYYPFDIGVDRRVTKILAGKDVINIPNESYGDTKAHRAWADVQAHLEEAKRKREWFRSVT